MNRSLLKTLVISLLLLPLLAISQEEGATFIPDSTVAIVLDQHKSFNTLHHGSAGFRIQIFLESGNFSKTKAYTVKEKFNTDYPNEVAYILFNEPYYKVRIGDFRTKLDAEHFLEQLIIDYPEAFIVPDNIRFPNMLE